jgi:hypothetical protein
MKSRTRIAHTFVAVACLILGTTAFRRPAPLAANLLLAVSLLSLVYSLLASQLARGERRVHAIGFLVAYLAGFAWNQGADFYDSPAFCLAGFASRTFGAADPLMDGLPHDWESVEHSYRRNRQFFVPFAQRMRAANALSPLIAGVAGAAIAAVMLRCARRFVHFKMSLQDEAADPKKAVVPVYKLIPLAHGLQATLAWSCVALCLAFAIFGVRSFFMYDNLDWSSHESRYLQVSSWQNRISVSWMAFPQHSDGIRWNTRTAAKWQENMQEMEAILRQRGETVRWTTPQAFRFVKHVQADDWDASIAHGFCVLIVGALAVLFRPTPRWRFSLRDLMILMTIAAVEFGVVASLPARWAS